MALRAASPQPRLAPSNTMSTAAPGSAVPPDARGVLRICADDAGLQSTVELRSRGACAEKPRSERTSSSCSGRRRSRTRPSYPHPRNRLDSSRKISPVHLDNERKIIRRKVFACASRRARTAWFGLAAGARRQPLMLGPAVLAARCRCVARIRCRSAHTGTQCPCSLPVEKLGWGACAHARRGEGEQWIFRIRRDPPSFRSG